MEIKKMKSVQSHKTVFSTMIIFFVCLMVLIAFKDQYSNILMVNSDYGMPALIKKGEVENLFIGSSTFRQGLDIDVLESNLGTDNYILAYNGNQPFLEYIQLKKIVDSGVRIKNLYVDMYPYTLYRVPGLDDEKMLMELDIREKWTVYDKMSDKTLSTLWNIFVSSNNDQIVMWPLTAPAIDSMFHKGGTLLYSAGMDEGSYDAIRPFKADDKVDSTQYRSLYDIIELCKQKDINIVFIETPKAKNIMEDAKYKEMMSFYSNILDEYGVKTILADISGMDNNDFSDGIHMSSEGRTEYTSRLVNELIFGH